MFRLFLWILGFLALGSPVGAATLELGTPPVWPESRAGLKTPTQKSPDGFQLPLSAGLGPVNPQSREASRLFFSTYYLVADSPIAWTGDGKTKIGIFRPSNGTWYLDVNGDGLFDNCVLDKCIPWGGSTDVPVAGRW
jgi:hypothetical protein